MMMFTSNTTKRAIFMASLLLLGRSTQISAGYPGVGRCVFESKSTTVATPTGTTGTGTTGTGTTGTGTTGTGTTGTGTAGTSTTGTGTTGTGTTGTETTARRFLSAKEEQDPMSGNLRASHSRALGGWFECGNIHCVTGRATCEVDADGLGACTCMDGYSGTECEPVDECETLSPCPGGSACIDMFPPMRYKCVCKEGFTPFLPNELPGEPDVPLDYRPIQCIDQVECESSPCHVDATCNNTVGGFECVCNGDLQGNGITTCEEPEKLDTPAVTDAPLCDGCCTNAVDCQGSNMQCVNATCACKPGYALVGRNCQNEVHCDPGGFNNDCHRRATCTEEDGFPGFSCKCIVGWEDAFEGANGKSCKDIPPVTEAPPAEPDGGGGGGVSDGVGPFPNRPTVFPPQCLKQDATCGSGVASKCCEGYFCDYSPISTTVSPGTTHTTPAGTTATQTGTTETGTTPAP